MQSWAESVQDLLLQPLAEDLQDLVLQSHCAAGKIDFVAHSRA